MLIKYQGKYLDVLNALLPNIINFNNFVQQEKDINNSENKLLLLVKYLFAKPQNINNGGFLDANSKIKNKASTNKNGEWSSVVEPLLSETLGQCIEVGKVKYNKPEEDSENDTKISYAITELLEIEKIKDSFNNLFTNSLNDDWGITITIPKSILGSQDYHHNFVILPNTRVKNSFAKAIFKKLDLISSESISISATFTEKMIFEYLDKTTKEWKKIIILVF